MNSLITYGLLILLGIWLLGLLFTYPLLHIFLMHPSKLPSDHEYKFASSSFEELFIKSPHEGMLNALLFKVPQSKGLILYFHGNAGDLSGWGEAHRSFTALGYDCLIFDYRGYGKSTGPINEDNMYIDAQAMYDYALQHYEADEIILYGRSLGSAFAGFIGKSEPVKHVILETPFSSIRNLFHTYFPFLPRVFIFKYHLPVKVFVEQTEVPVTVFHGTDDFIVPLKCAKKIKPVLKDTDKFITIENRGHNDVSMDEKYLEELSKILQ